MYVALKKGISENKTRNLHRNKRKTNIIYEALFELCRVGNQELLEFARIYQLR